MDCKFRVLIKDKKVFEQLKKYASGWSEKGLIIIDAKCDFLDILKKFSIEMLITPFRSGEGYVDCFYYNGEIKDCNEKILEKFDVRNYEPIYWKKSENNIPF